jgi:hypothetical protein
MDMNILYSSDVHLHPTHPFHQHPVLCDFHYYKISIMCVCFRTLSWWHMEQQERRENNVVTLISIVQELFHSFFFCNFFTEKNSHVY